MGSIEISRKYFELRHSFSSDRRKQCEGAKASWRAGCSHTVLLKAQELLCLQLSLYLSGWYPRSPYSQYQPRKGNPGGSLDCPLEVLTATELQRSNQSAPYKPMVPKHALMEYPWTKSYSEQKRQQVHMLEIAKTGVIIEISHGLHMLKIVGKSSYSRQPEALPRTKANNWEQSSLIYHSVLCGFVLFIFPLTL